MKKLSVWIITFGIVSLLLQGCGEKPNIKIGFIGTLTGTNSDIGIGIRDGFLLKVDEINDQGGINGRLIEVIVRDDKLDKALVMQYHKELVDLGVTAIFGNELSSKAEIMLEATQNQQVILVSPTLSTYEISGLDDQFFRTITTNFDQGLALGNHARGKTRKALITYDAKNEKFAQGVYEGFLDVYDGQVGYFPIDQAVDKIEKDYIVYFLEGGYDGVLYIMNPHDVMYMSQVLYRSKLDADIYSSNWGMATNQFADGGRAIEDAVFVSLLGRLENESYKVFERSFLGKYNRQPEYASTYSYEAANLLFDALQNAKSIDYDSIKKELTTIGRVNGLIDEYELDQYGDVSRKTYLGVVKDGELILQD